MIKKSYKQITVLNFVLLLLLVAVFYVGEQVDRSRENNHLTVNAQISTQAIEKPYNYKGAGLEKFGLKSYASRFNSLGPLPNSLSNTDVDASLEIDAEGKVVPNTGMRQLFEYFLSTLGDETLDEVSIRLANFLSEKLPSEAAEEVWKNFALYLEYKQTLANNAEEAESIFSLSEMQSVDEAGAGNKIKSSKLRERFELIHLTRTQVLGDELTEAFYGDEERYDRFTLDRLDLENTKMLDRAQLSRAQLSLDKLSDDESEKETYENALAELEQTLPESWQKMRMESHTMNEVHKKVEKLKASGASVEEIHLLRQEKLGVEAAQRLQSLDDQRKTWLKRYETYRRLLDDTNNSHMAEVDKEKERLRLIDSHFSNHEYKRVLSLNALAASTSSVSAY